MDKIEVKVLNPEVIVDAERMMVCAARLTQAGHTIKCMDDFIDLYNKDYKASTAKLMVGLPHPTIQKFGVINIVVVGASRRFLAQITRHQNEVKFMSASCQYSDYTGEADFVVPAGVLQDEDKKKAYLDSCREAMSAYTVMAADPSVGKDQAGYVAPQGLRNILIISATPYQLKHMIRQRICRRNTVETQHVMLMVAIELQKYGGALFQDVLPECCKEKSFTCGRPMKAKRLASYLKVMPKQYLIR